MSFKSLDALKTQLPIHLTIVTPDGLKNGEVWVRSNQKRRVSWFVVDALSGQKMTAANDRGSELLMMKTFPTYGIGDPKIFVKWVKTQLAKDKPTLIVPCHGSITANQQMVPAVLEILGRLKT